MNIWRLLLPSLIACSVALLSSCEPESPQLGTQTNWLTLCETSDDCGELSCICGTCTRACSAEPDCHDLTAATCIDRADQGAIAACDGQTPAESFCLPRCGDEVCPAGTACVAGVCAALRPATVSVSIEPTIEYQTLLGFGASLAYNETLIAGHPQKAALYDAMFSESGFEIVRLRNGFTGENMAELELSSEILGEATARLGAPPLLFMTSGSPPAALKANDNAYCANSDVNCTLARTADGGFDYLGFAEHWRASLEAYAQVGIFPDWISIQNNADFIPPDAMAIEACRFLPEEGTAQVTTPDGQTVDAEFAGYAEAMAAVTAAVSTLPDPYSFAGPETASAVMAAAYADHISDVQAIAYHLYGMDPESVALDHLENVRAMGEASGSPIIQSEMIENGINTAILAHYALTVAHSSAYLQHGFVTPSLDEESGALIGADAGTFIKLPAYHALSHFARSTASGYIRIEATTDSSDLLSSAWLSPEKDALTLVLINPEDVPIDLKVELPESFASADATIVRTVFDGVERSSELGSLSAARVVRIPGQGLVTVAFE